MAWNQIPGRAAPDQGDRFIRRLEKLERDYTALLPSIAQVVPRIAGETVTNDNFALTSGQWVTAAECVIAPPKGPERVAVVSASGFVYVVANTAFAVPTVRLRINDSVSMEVELPEGTGASAIPYFGTLAHAAEVAAPEGVTIALEVFVLSGSAWHTGALNRKAQVNAIGVYATGTPTA